jgi:vacuolar-type H+-ATPase subunit I/STV1
MFRPARMARVVLGGHKEHMRGVIETLHREALLHLEDYADPTGSTAIGTPLEEGDQISELLLRTRGLLKSLGIEEGTAKQMAPSDPASMVDEAEARILPVLEDLSAARAEAAKHEADAAALADLEILDVDLSLTSLTSVRGFVGSARGDVAAALDAAGIAHETASGEDAVATFVAAKDGARAEAVLAQLGFVAATLPAGTTRPRERLAEARRGLVAAQERVTKAEAELATLATEWGSRLGALEHHLAFEADRTQAPLHFRETATTFHAEGWVPRGKANRTRPTPPTGPTHRTLKRVRTLRASPRTARALCMPADTTPTAPERMTHTATTTTPRTTRPCTWRTSSRRARTSSC